MELWVRSQKKGCLIKVNDLRIMQFDKDNFKALIDEEAVEGWSIVANDDPCIGTYKTKERALEVLDEIQNIIIGKYMTNLNFEASFSKFDDEEEARKTLIAMAVYEMPKE